MEDFDEASDAAPRVSVEAESLSSIESAGFDELDEPEEELAARKPYTRRRLTRGEFIVTLIIIVLLILICVYGLPVLLELLQTIQLDNNGISFFPLPLL